MLELFFDSLELNAPARQELPLRNLPRPAELSRKKADVQRLIGSLKFIELLASRLSPLLHHLNCIISARPLAAMDNSRAALATVHTGCDIGSAYGGTGLAATPQLGGSAFTDLSAPAPARLEAHASSLDRPHSSVGHPGGIGGYPYLVFGPERGTTASSATSRSPASASSPAASTRRACFYTLGPSRAACCSA
jgi:hypothetical protein